MWYTEGEAGEDLCRRVDWLAFTAAGRSARVCSTYHDPEGGWYLRLPEAWIERLVTERMMTADETTVTFSLQSGEQRLPLLRVSALTGTNPERQAARPGRFVLSRAGNVIYAAELLSGAQSAQYGVTEDELRTAFTLIAKEWSAGDN
ncbi:MAG: hypothetical protein IKN53_01120 [Oscillibacter sp.]|nr:hypothetical protein [Oscillibacter sp.]